MRLGAPLSCALALVAACYDLGGFAGGTDAADAGSDAPAPIDAGGDTSNDAGTDAAPALTAYQATVLADAPIGFWPLGDRAPTAADLGPHALAGTFGSGVVEDAPPVLPSDPKAASAGFPGTTGSANVIRIARTPLLEPTNAVSVEAWVIVSVLQSSELASYGPQAMPPYQPWVLQMESSGFQLYMANVGNIVGASVPMAGARYHVVGIYDGANARIYVNGMLDASAAASGALNDYDGTTGLAIGGGWNGELPCKGSIADVAVYDHVLAPERVSAHYTAGITPP